MLDIPKRQTRRGSTFVSGEPADVLAAFKPMCQARAKEDDRGGQDHSRVPASRSRAAHNGRMCARQVHSLYIELNLRSQNRTFMPNCSVLYLTESQYPLRRAD